MNTLAYFERWVERLIEGPFDWLFKTRLHVADLTKALARALETGKISNGRGGYLAPNTYQVFLNEQDYQAIQEGAGLGKEIGAIKRYLRHLMAEMDGDLPGAVQVQIFSQPDIPIGQIKVMADHLDLAQTAPPSVEGPPSIERAEGATSFRPKTKQLKRPPVATTAGQWRLHLPQGVVMLGMPVVRIGRGQNNDVILADRTVSKYHAQLRWRHQTYYAQNLSPTCPLKVNQQVVTGSSPLKPGDQLQLGGATIRLDLDLAE